MVSEHRDVQELVGQFSRVPTPELLMDPTEARKPDPSV
jgi:hypothetical protein